MNHLRTRSVAVLLLFLPVASCADDGGVTNGGGGSNGATVVMENVAFQPADLTVEAGTTVTWRHQDPGLAHTTTAQDGSWDSGEINEGDEFSFTLDVPGTYPFICEIHPNQMTGVITVTEPGTAGAPGSASNTMTPEPGAG